jgi:hypothetical protein
MAYTLKNFFSKIWEQNTRFNELEEERILFNRERNHDFWLRKWIPLNYDLIRNNRTILKKNVTIEEMAILCNLDNEHFSESRGILSHMCNIESNFDDTFYRLRNYPGGWNAFKKSESATVYARSLFQVGVLARRNQLFLIQWKKKEQKRLNDENKKEIFCERVIESYKHIIRTGVRCRTIHLFVKECKLFTENQEIFYSQSISRPIAQKLSHQKAILKLSRFSNNIHVDLGSRLIAY